MSNFIISAFSDEISPDLKVQMDVLESHGIKHMELRGICGRNIVEYSIEKAREFKKELDKRGFKVSAIGSPIGKIKTTDDFTPHLELFKHTLDLAKLFETKYIRMFSFFIPEGIKAEECRDEVMKRWQQFIEAAAGKEVILLHENEKGIYGDTPERCKDILDTMECIYLRATFDPANFIQCDCETYPHSFEVLKEHIEYIHIKDAKYSDHKVVPSGFGDGRIYEILSELKKMNFNVFLSLEPHLAGFKGFEKLEPNSPINNMEEGNEKSFAIAELALRNIISRLYYNNG